MGGNERGIRVIVIGYYGSGKTILASSTSPIIGGTSSMAESFNEFALTRKITSESLLALRLSLNAIKYNNYLELEEIRSGWNNPNKIGYPISAKTIYKNNMIRNRLKRNKLRFNEIAN